MRRQKVDSQIIEVYIFFEKTNAIEKFVMHFHFPLGYNCFIKIPMPDKIRPNPRLIAK